MKLKLNRRQIIIGAAVLVVLAFALFAGRAGKTDPQGGVLDDPARTACTNFADGYPDAKTKTARLALADKVMESTGQTDNDLIADRAAELGRAANDANAEWKTRADALRDACTEAGWKAA
ncbi:hypothetical protein GCM10010435_57070 [Winogradskya consettensis]|uniref:Uncharacterized protein n=1 Tax=Winogradskya consettensis TaxID=113560 RepID=A0A919S9F6_9ACTN|nr:hypothetical protein [Actinoplanes consettensis]GIM67210.1 hypothetical protein Aco04nite_05250 [Actinoplanes consettensis]